MLSGEMESENIMSHRVVSIMFMDIVGFSSLCEQLPPELLLKMTTQYLQEMCEAIVSSGGVLDKVCVCACLCRHVFISI